MTKLRTLLATGAFAVATAFAAAPAQAQNVIDTAHQAGTFNTFLTAIDAAGMTDLLATSNPITVFAPTDEAFAEMGAGAVDSLLQPENIDELRRLIRHHVVMLDLPSSALRNKQIRSQYTLGFTQLPITTLQAAVRIDEADVVVADIEAENGVIHAIDAVLRP